MYYTRCVEDLKTRHQWRMLMKDVIMRDVAPPVAESHAADPTAACASTGSGTLRDASVSVSVSGDGSLRSDSSSYSSSSSSSSLNRLDKGERTGLSSDGNAGEEEREGEEDDVVVVDERDSGVALREPLPPHKVVMRKRGDTEVRVELYGVWQTEAYKVSNLTPC